MIANSRCIACNLSKKEEKFENIQMKKEKGIYSESYRDFI